MVGSVAGGRGQVYRWAVTSNLLAFFVRDGILSVADYNLTLIGVVVVVVVYFFAMG